MDARNFLDLILQQFTSEITQNKAIKQFSDHPLIKGQLAELLVRRLVKQVVSPLHVCTGAVIDEKICSSDRKNHQNHQVDVIIWSPSPMPALFCMEGFGLVPRSSCFGIMEIKSSSYRNGQNDLAEKLASEEVYKVVSDVHLDQGFVETLETDPFLKNLDRNDLGALNFPALGVICYKNREKLKPSLEKLKREGKLVILFDEEKGDKPDSLAVARIINFLIMTKRRARFMEGRDFINTEILINNEVLPVSESNEDERAFKKDFSRQELNNTTPDSSRSGTNTAWINHKVE